MIGGRKFRTEQARARERTRILVRTILAGIGVVGLIVSALWGLSSESMRISSVTVSTDGDVRPDDIGAAVERAFAGTHALFIPNDSILFTGVDAVRKEILTSFPRIATVDFARVGLTGLTATVHERVPAALWCGDVVPEIAYKSSKEQSEAHDEAWGTCFLMDGDGYLYAKSPTYSGNVFMRYYGPLNEASPIGQNFITHDEFASWQSFFRDLAHDGLVVRALLIVDERDCELYLDNGLRVLVPRTEPLSSLRDRLTSLMAERAIDTNKNIEYVDMRFGGKAFVKYLEIPEPPTTP